MTDFTRFFLLGLGAGGIYALLGLGLVLIYRGSGVINFAQGAVGLLGLIFFYEYRSSAGDIGALVIGVVAAALLGALIQIAVMRPMRRSSALVRLIATLAILTIIQEGALIKYGPTPLFVTSFLPDSSWNVFSNVYVGVDRLLILGIAIVLTIVLDVVYRKTKFGLATTAVAENERATASFGWSPNLVAVGNWTAGCALAGFAAILLGPITSLSPNSVVLTVLPALAAALLGGFRSFPLTLAGGVAIGVMEAEATRYIHAPGWPTSAALIVIGAILVFRGRALPARGYRADRLPRIGSGEINRIVAVCAIALVAVSLFVFTDGWATSLITLAASGLIILSFVVLTGYCGQLSLAQYAIAGIGALIASRFADALQVPMPVAFVIGVVLTIPVGMLVALPAVRVRGINLAVLTLGLAIVIEAVVFSNVDYTGGALKGTIVKPEVFGWDVLSIFHPQRYAAICLAIFAIGLFVVANIRRGRSGRRMIAVRSNEQAAASLGISVVGAKLYAFGVGAALAAAGGIMYAFQTEHVDFTRYAAFQSVVLLLQAVLGGVGYVTGAIFGGLGAQGGPANEITSHWWGSSDWFLLIGAAITLLVIITHPEGVAGATAESAARLRRVFRRRAGREAAPESERGRWELSAESTMAISVPRTLEIVGLTVDYGGVRAVDDVTMTVVPGQIVGLIGPNGAGKTTLVDAVTGFVGYQGSVRLDGVALDRSSATHRSRAGITRSFQALELFEDMSVGDNLRTASDRHDRATYVTDVVHPGKRKLPGDATFCVDEFQLADVLDRSPRELSYAERRLVAIARAVATGPSILLLDEPAAGLDEQGTAELSRAIRSLAKNHGIGILVIEHDVSFVVETCDHIEVLDFGRTLASGTPQEIRHNPAVIAAYLGEAPDEEPRAGAVADAEGNA